VVEVLAIVMMAVLLVVLLVVVVLAVVVLAVLAVSCRRPHVVISFGVTSPALRTQ
jgi:hypothetical protein